MLFDDDHDSSNHQLERAKRRSRLCEHVDSKFGQSLFARSTDTTQQTFARGLWELAIGPIDLIKSSIEFGAFLGGKSIE